MKNVVSKEVFEKEISMCKKLNKENRGKCNWGECEKCGVIPLLYKLGKGEFLENSENVKIVKKSVFET